MSKECNIYSEFNINKHKETYINYLEVIIDAEGTVYYAVPSHQEFLINYICKRDNLTRNELDDLCPREYYFDFMTWLCKISKCISVWNNFYFGIANEKQKLKLKELSENKLYTGNI